MAHTVFNPSLVSSLQVGGRTLPPRAKWRMSDTVFRSLLQGPPPTGGYRLQSAWGATWAECGQRADSPRLTIETVDFGDLEPMTTRKQAALVAAGIRDLDTLRRTSDRTLIRLPDIGKTTVTKWRDWIRDHDAHRTD